MRTGYGEYRMRRKLASNLLLSAVLPILVCFAPVPEICTRMNPNQYHQVESKNQIEEIISEDILSMHAQQGRVDWNGLIQCFENLGDIYSVNLIPNGGFDNADIIRFSIDKTNILTNLTSVPGASNGIFTAIINRTADGRVAIVQRGGKLKWLKLE